MNLAALYYLEEIAKARAAVEALLADHPGFTMADLAKRHYVATAKSKASVEKALRELGVPENSQLPPSETTQ